jgi:hypothetical protein
MGWWSAKRNEKKERGSLQVELANTNSIVRNSIKKGIIVQDQTASPCT